MSQEQNLQSIIQLFGCQMSFFHSGQMLSQILELIKRQSFIAIKVGLLERCLWEHLRNYEHEHEQFWYHCYCIMKIENQFLYERRIKKNNEDKGNILLFFVSFFSISSLWVLVCHCRECLVLPVIDKNNVISIKPLKRWELVKKCEERIEHRENKNEHFKMSPRTQQKSIHCAETQKFCEEGIHAI